MGAGAVDGTVRDPGDPRDDPAAEGSAGKAGEGAGIYVYRTRTFYGNHT